jgi:diaminohydroxyphosphoribosylaminopyrimidine deaminase/5-amino-6-(5-phosphoribosylamino)uracil reductase
VSDAQTRLDARMMLRALRAAERGDPGPNPHVGAVIARSTKVVSVGFHAHADAPHAALLAIQRAGRRARGATLYVTSAPGVTPCTAAIIAAGLRRVVIGCALPARAAPGSSARLRRHHIEVVSGVEQARARRLVADFEKFTLRGLPEVTLKAAVTLDGRSAARSGESKWITGEAARRETHRMRARADAVLVGVGTVLADDPELTVRAVRGRTPLRVVLDTELRTPLRAKLVQSARRHRTLLLHARGVSEVRRQKLTAAGMELAEVKRARGGSGLDLEAALRELARRDVVRLLVEGGAHVHGALLDAGLVDRVAVFVAPCLLVDAQALPLAAGQTARRLDAALRIREPEWVRLGDDVLVRGALATEGLPRSRATDGSPRSRGFQARTAGPGRRTRL